MKILQKNIENHYNKQLPFVVYNKPNSEEVCGMFQKDASLHVLTNSFDRQGFVFAPFHSSGTTVLIPLEASEVLYDAISSSDKAASEHQFTADVASKTMHMDLVEKGVTAIQEAQFEKVVLSRKQEVDLGQIDIVNTYTKLLQAYPNAFVYVWFHPEIGLWFGATPETLVQLQENEFTTMSLAGTQPYSETVATTWSQKEIDEQAFVTKYITDKLSNFSKTVEVSKTTTVKAGSLAHLRTDIRGILDTSKENALFSLVAALHPTPAVCGLPKEAAVAFIEKNEQYDRGYYTGFLGELRAGEAGVNEAHLFVNLRCMELQNSKAYIYVGGGITKDSDPYKEWLETVAKSAIMFNVLD